MKVIVTGASGFIGRNVLLRAPRTWQVYALFNRAATLDAFVRERGLTHVTVVPCDLLDADAVRAVAERVGGRADAALYLAANGDPAASVERVRWDLESHAVAVVNFLEHCRVGHVVYVSSGAVYDGLVGDVSPASPLSPRLPYAIAKLAAEQYVRFFCERRHSVDSFINVRFFGAYGPYEPARKITTKWMRAVMDGQRELTIRGDGENLIDFMYIDDAVDGFLTLAAAAGTSTTVDFASGAPISVNEVARALAGALGVSISVRHAGHSEEYIRFRTVDPGMRERFGVVPKISFADGVAHLHRFLASEAV